MISIANKGYWLSFFWKILNVECLSFVKFPTTSLDYTCNTQLATKSDDKKNVLFWIKITDGYINI